MASADYNRFNRLNIFLPFPYDSIFFGCIEFNFSGAFNDSSEFVWESSNVFFRKMTFSSSDEGCEFDGLYVQKIYQQSIENGKLPKNFFA